VDAWVEERVLSTCTIPKLNDTAKDVDADFAIPSQEFALHTKDERTVICGLANEFSNDWTSTLKRRVSQLGSIITGWPST
jgi:hypothetical protein